MIMAARLLDAMPQAWTGAASTSTQALGWPRTGMESRNGYTLASGVIPNDLKYAQFEYALKLIAGDLTAGNDVIAQGIKSIKAGPVSLAFKETLARADALAQMIPDVVVALLVPSWLIDPRDEDAPYTGLVFDSLEDL